MSKSFSESFDKFKAAYRHVDDEDKPALWMHMLIAPVLIAIAIIWAFGWPGALFCFGWFMRWGTQST